MLDSDKDPFTQCQCYLRFGTLVLCPENNDKKKLCYVIKLLRSPNRMLTKLQSPQQEKKLVTLNAAGSITNVNQSSCQICYLLKKGHFLQTFCFWYKENIRILFERHPEDLFDIFYAPEIEDRGAVVFVLSVILSFCPPLWNVNLANNFWTVSARALIFHMSIPCDKTFPWIPFFYPWPWSLTFFFKTLTLQIAFEQWVLELWNFTWVFFVIRPFSGYHYFLPCDLDLGVWPIFWKI